jgi:hypothetical protein
MILTGKQQKDPAEKYYTNKSDSNSAITVLCFNVEASGMLFGLLSVNDNY